VIFYSIAIILVIVYCLWYFPIFGIKGLPRNTMALAFVLKLIVGFLLIYIHDATYGSSELSHDGQTFMQEGKILNEVFYESPKSYLQLLTGIQEPVDFAYRTEYWAPGDLTIINDSKNVIRLHSLIHFISFDQEAIHLAIFCLIALIGFKLIYISFRKYFVIDSKLSFWVLLLLPTSIFWTSSLMKEPLLLLGLGLLSYGIIKENNWKFRIIILLFALFILIGIKPYVLICLISGLFCYLVVHYFQTYKIWVSIFCAILLILIISPVFKTPKNYIVHNLNRKQFDFVNVGKGGLHVKADTCFYYFQPHQYEYLSFQKNKVALIKPTSAYIMRFGSTQKPVLVHLTPNGEQWEKVYQSMGCSSYIELTPINDSYYQLLCNIPEALINSTLRPFPSDPGSNLKYLAIAEMYLMTLFIFFALKRRRKLDFRERKIVVFLITFALVLLVLIGWTTPVLGAIVRYRFPAQLAVVLALLIIQKPLTHSKWINTL